MYKKLISIILMLVFMSSILFSCSNEGVEGADSDNAKGKEKEVIDLNGYVFKFKTTEHAANTPELFPPVANNERGDKILARYDETEDEFNCEIDVEVITGDISPQLIASYATGDKYADLVDTYISFITNNEMYYAPFEDYEKIDLTDEKWGYPNFLESTKKNGKTYGVFSQAWGLPAPAFMGSIFFLPRIFKEASVPNPQEEYEKKNWDWQTFEKYCELMTVTGEGGAIERYGAVFAQEMQLARAVIMANGVEFIEKDPNTGLYKLMVEDPKVIQAVDWIKSLIDKKLAKYESDWWQKAAQGLIDGIYAFHSATCYHAFYDGVAHFANECPDDTAWIPVPVGPSGTYDTPSTSFTAGFRAMGMPLNDEEDMENNVLIMDYIFEPLEGETSETWQTYLKRQFFFDDLSFDYYMKLLKTTKYDYSGVIPTSASTILSTLNEAVMGKKTVTEAFGSKKDKIQADIDKYLNNIEE